jgi:hypothetical protein
MIRTMLEVGRGERSQAADAGNEERSQHTMLYTFMSTPTLDGVSSFVWVP